MKYKITGINPALTIKNYKLCREGIKVTYLNGGTDFHSIEKKETIDKKMLEQAEIFVNNPNRKNKEMSELFMGLSALFGTCGCVLITFDQILIGLVSIIVTFTSAIIANKLIQFNAEYKEKYKLYLENKKNLEIQYNDVRTSEKILCKEQVNEQNEVCIINELDKISLKELKNMLAKVERYQEIEPEVIESGYQKTLGGLK